MNDADREILDQYIRTREKTLELLNCVPIDWLSRTAEGEDMTLSWLFVHVADGPNWWMHHAMRDGKGWAYPGDGPFDKDTTQNALTESMQRFLTFFEADDGRNMNQFFQKPTEENAADERWTGRNRLLYFIAHEIHHRGRIELALRQWGMTDLPFMP